jgi:Fe2+ transport system protein FeoA
VAKPVAVQATLHATCKGTFVTSARAVAPSRPPRPIGFHGRMASPPAFPAAVPLSSLATGRSARVVAIPADAAAALAAEGLAAGDLLEIETRQPCGGPVVVRVGHARLALAARIARGIVVEPLGVGAPTR